MDKRKGKERGMLFALLDLVVLLDARHSGDSLSDKETKVKKQKGAYSASPVNSRFFVAKLRKKNRH